MSPKRYFGGITGGSASGKTSFIHALRESFGPQKISLLSQDNYYREARYHIRDEKGEINFDLPECIDYEAFFSDLEKLRADQEVIRPEYLFQLKDREPDQIHILPAPIIVVEGLFIFYFERIFQALDLKIFVDASDDVKLKRRLFRDITERGVPEDLVLYQWENHVLPAYEKYLLPFKNAADIVINNNEHFLNSLEVLKNHFRQILSS